MMASGAHSRVHLGANFFKAPIATSQILTTSFQALTTTLQVEVQTRTQLNVGKSIVD
jgi:hypothetical protein